MSDVNIIGSVQIDTGESAKRLSDLSQEIKTQSKAWKDAKVGSDEYVIAQQKLKIASEEYNKVAAEVNATQDKSGEAFGILKSKLGDAVPGFKGASDGAQGFGAQLKILAANPIILILTAIVAVLALVYEAFAGTIEGGKQMKQVMAGLEAVGTQVKDAFFGLVRALVDVFVAAWKFITLDFKGAKESMKQAGDESAKAFGELNKAVGETYQKFKALEAAQQANDKARKVAAVTQSETDKLLVKSREILTDETASIKEKKKALEEVTVAETKTAAEKARIANEDLRIAKDKQAAYGAETEAAKKMNQDIRDLTVAANEADKENAQTEIKLNKQKKMLKKQEEAEDNEAKKAKKEKEKAAREKEKEARENERAYDDKMLKYHRDEQLSTFKDAIEKEKQVEQNKYEDEIKQAKDSFEAHKITIAQRLDLEVAAKNARDQKFIELDNKHKQEIKKTEIDFEKQLAEIKKGTNTSEETDQRKKELATLKADMEAKTKAILDNEKFTFSQKEILLAALSNEEKAKEDAINKKFEDEHLKAKEQLSLKEISAEMKAGKNKYDLQVSLINQKQKIESAMYAREIKEAKGNADKIDEINQRRTESEKANTEARIEAKKKEMEFMLSEVGAVGNALSTMSDIAGKQTAAGKALSIASTTIKTIQGGISAFMGMVDEIPGPVGIALGAVAAAGVVASGVKSVQDITKVEVPGQGGGGSVPNISVNSPVLPSPVQTSTSLNSSSIQGIGNAAGNAGRAFVLDRDIKDNAERDAVLTRRARLG